MLVVFVAESSALLPRDKSECVALSNRLKGRLVRFTPDAELDSALHELNIEAQGAEAVVIRSIPPESPEKPREDRNWPNISVEITEIAVRTERVEISDVDRDPEFPEQQLRVVISPQSQLCQDFQVTKSHAVSALVELILLSETEEWKELKKWIRENENVTFSYLEIFSNNILDAGRETLTTWDSFVRFESSIRNPPGKPVAFHGDIPKLQDEILSSSPPSRPLLSGLSVRESDPLRISKQWSQDLATAIETQSHNPQLREALGKKLTTAIDEAIRAAPELTGYIESALREGNSTIVDMNKACREWLNEIENQLRQASNREIGGLSLRHRTEESIKSFLHTWMELQNQFRKWSNQRSARFIGHVGVGVALSLLAIFELRLFDKIWRFITAGTLAGLGTSLLHERIIREGFRRRFHLVEQKFIHLWNETYKTEVQYVINTVRDIVRQQIWDRRLRHFRKQIFNILQRLEAIQSTWTLWEKQLFKNEDAVGLLSDRLRQKVQRSREVVMRGDAKSSQEADNEDKDLERKWRDTCFKDFTLNASHVARLGERLDGTWNEILNFFRNKQRASIDSLDSTLAQNLTWNSLRKTTFGPINPLENQRRIAYLFLPTAVDRNSITLDSARVQSHVYQDTVLCVAFFPCHGPIGE